MRSSRDITGDTDLRLCKFFGLSEGYFLRLQNAYDTLEAKRRIAAQVPRSSPSFKESVLIDELIRKEQVELHFYREGMVIGKGASSTDILRWDFSVMGAKSYVLNLSENVRRSLEYKRRNGEWGGKAPLGYSSVRKPSKSDSPSPLFFRTCGSEGKLGFHCVRPST
jgi:DNA invertase Pin-like site-specific DNA recombinase